MSDQLVSFELRENVALLTMDDGKANAINYEMIEALGAALDRAEKEADAVVLTGRPGRFCAGFDLSIMQSGVENLRKLVGAGVELMLRLYLFPKPLVLACSGHAMAGGAVMLQVGDLRLGVQGPFKIGLNEVAIGLPVPAFAVSFSRPRLAKPHFEQATLLARVYDPDGAVQAGFLDGVCEPDALIDEALAKAKAFAKYPSMAFSLTKKSTRGAVAKEVREELQANLDALTGFSR